MSQWLFIGWVLARREVFLLPVAWLSSQTGKPPCSGLLPLIYLRLLFINYLYVHCKTKWRKAAPATAALLITVAKTLFLPAGFDLCLSDQHYVVCPHSCRRGWISGYLATQLLWWKETDGNGPLIGQVQGLWLDILSLRAWFFGNVRKEWEG